MNRKAFTLVELLIVIIIIGILATMAVPQYQKMVMRSKLSGMWITLGALREGVYLYRAEYGKSPTTRQGWVNITATTLQNNNITLDLPFNQYAIWWATGNDSPARNATKDMGISLDNMAFYICPLVPYATLPHGCMSEQGKKSYCISGAYMDNANWIFE